MKRLVAILAFLWLSSHDAWADGLEEAQVIAVKEGGSVLLADGRSLAFADLLFPDAARAQTWLGSHLLQQTLSFSAMGEDRYGRILVLSEVEETMLRQGVAVLFPQEEILDRWQAAEDAARLARRGVWAEPEFVLSPENAAQHLQQFHVVEGVVTHLYRDKKATYLNFGEHWQTDFSVTISGRARRSIEAKLAGVHEGSKIRVRGTLYEENGPMSRVTRPEQIEIVQ